MATSISTEEIAHVARLARIRFTPEELTGFTDQFNQILSYVEQLNEVETEGIEPMTSTLVVANVMRDDTPGPLLTPEEALKNAPRRTEGFFSVPKVIGDVDA